MLGSFRNEATQGLWVGAVKVGAPRVVRAAEAPGGARRRGVSSRPPLTSRQRQGLFSAGPSPGGVATGTDWL